MLDMAETTQADASLLLGTLGDQVSTLLLSDLQREQNGLVAQMQTPLSPSAIDTISQTSQGLRLGQDPVIRKILPAFRRRFTPRYTNPTSPRVPRYWADAR